MDGTLRLGSSVRGPHNLWCHLERNRPHHRCHLKGRAHGLALRKRARRLPVGAPRFASSWLAAISKTTATGLCGSLRWSTTGSQRLERVARYEGITIEESDTTIEESEWNQVTQLRSSTVPFDRLRMEAPPGVPPHI